MTALGAIAASSDIATAPGAAIATGVVLPYAGDGGTAPAGWVYCRGQTLDKTSSTGGVSHAALNALIGDAASPAHRYNGGSSPGANLFRVPDLRQVFPVGANDTSGLVSGPSDANPSGPTGGGTFSDGAWGHAHAAGTLSADTHSHLPGTLTLPSHSHASYNLYNTHSHNVTMANDKLYYPSDTPVQINRRTDLSNNAGGSAVSGTSGASTAPVTYTVNGTAYSGALTLTGSTGTADPPYLVVNFIVKL